MKSLSIRTIPVLCSVLLLSSCAIGPNYQRPDINTLPAYRNDSMPSDSLANLSWWELFNDPMLDTLVTTALRHNRTVLAAASRVEEARAAHGFTKADIFPRVDIQAGASRGNYAQGMKLPDIGNNFYVAPVLSWEIDFWGKLRRANESAYAAMMSSEFAHRSVQVGLISEVTGTYIALLDYRQRLDVARQTLASRQKSLDIIRARFEEGIIPEIDLNQAQIQREIAASSIPAYERLVARTEHALSALLGALPMSIRTGAGIHAQVLPPDIPPGLPSELLARRPDIIEAEYALQSANAQIGVAQGMRLPSINLTGILGFASPELSTLTSDGSAWSLSGSLLGPLFNFGKNLRRVDIARAQTMQARYRYENAVLQAFREVEDALVEVRTYKEQVAAVDRKLLAARNAAGLSAERYDKGVTSYLEVLETERTLFDVELELSELRRLYLNSYVLLYKALGGGWISPQERSEENTAARQQ